MYFLQGISLSLMAYLASAMILFGGFLRPIGFLTFWNDRLAISNWPIFIVVGVGAGLGLSFLSVRFGLKPRFVPAIFIVCAMACSTIGLGAYTESQRSKEIERFSPDLAIRASFYSSLRSAPRDFQFFLHGAALKDCVPYAWSYRTMSFYELPQNVAVNVLPSAWIEECEIKRTG
jgi:hypothetical protein